MSYLLRSRICYRLVGRLASKLSYELVTSDGVATRKLRGNSCRGI